MPKKDQISTEVSPELKADFDAFCQKFNLTQKGAIATLLERYGDDELKDLAPGQADAIAAFGRYQQGMKELFTVSIRQGVEARDAARDELKLELDRKDRTIDNYQQQVQNLQAEADRAKELARQMSEQAGTLATQLEAAKQANEESKQINEGLKKDIADAQAKADAYDQLMADYNALKAEYDALKVANLEEQLAQFRQMVEDATKPKPKDKTKKEKAVQPKTADTTISFLE